MEVSQNRSAVSDKHRWNQNPALGKLPVQLTDILNDIILPSGLKLPPQPYREAESMAYGACMFEIEDKTVMFRVAHTTTSKIGQFVSIWKRSNNGGEIEPVDGDDPVDYMIISVFDTENRGIFIFDKHILTKKNIMSVNKKGGKRGIRVYAPWTKPLVKQALQTQKWQNQYFLSMDWEQRLKSDFISNIFLRPGHI